MATTRSRGNSKLVSWAVAQLDTLDNDLVVIDVGASGGVDHIWRQWQPRVQAYCFDPIVNEIERLVKEEADPKIHYHAAFVTCDDYDYLNSNKVKPARSNACFHLTSATRAAEIMRIDYKEQSYNRGQSITYSEKKTTIDRFCAENSIEAIDFIKTDTDGYDYFVLRGARETLAQANLLGLEVECSLHGKNGPHANGFSNIDTLLRSHGFTLFDLEMWRYTRSALPGPFYYDIPAATVDGQVQWGEAIYLRDPCIDDSFLLPMSSAQRHAAIVKLAALYEMFGFPDCAAQLLLTMKERSMLPANIDLPAVLDLLVPDNTFGITTYRDYIGHFEKDPTNFYPSNIPAKKICADIKLEIEEDASQNAPEKTHTIFASIRNQYARLIAMRNQYRDR